MAVDPWASYNAGMQNLGSSFDDIRREQREAPLRALQLRMLENKAAEGDIALREAQTTAADRLALRQKVAGAQPITETTITPRSPAAASLLSIPGQQYTQPQQPFSMEQAASPIVQAYNEGRVQSKTTQPDLAAITKQTLLEQGNVKGAAEAGKLQVETMAIDDVLAKKRAEIEMYGTPDAKAKLDVMEARLKTAENFILTSRKADPSGNMTKQIIKAHPELFPGIDPDAISTSASLTELPFKGGKLVIGPDGKSHVVQDKITDVDKYVESQKANYKSQTGVDMPASVEADLRMKYHRALKPETNITTKIINKEQTEEAKTVGKGQGEKFLDIQKAADAGQKSINMYSRMENLLEGVKTGKLTPTGTQIAALADSLGIPIDKNLGNKQAALALGNQLALELRNPAGGAGMPGAMSDKDREFLVSSIPNIDKTPEGNKLMIGYAKKIAKRNIEVAKLANQYRRKNGTLDIGFNDELAAYSEAHPLFTSTKENKPSLNDIFK